MSISGQRTHLQLVTVGDFDPQSDQAIEYEFIGRVIAGRYKVQAAIGGGGMADVFRATDEELGVDVAIKLLKPPMASDELRARMVQEARAAAQVRHANLVRVFGTGTLDRTAYIVMELLDGPNLEQYLCEHRDQRLPWREAIELLLPALEALHAVHDRGYVHRDIKTGNILVTREPGRPPTAIVIDLGLVKADPARRDAASPPTTEVGRMLCTPGYTSPEQAAGLTVDRRSDVYSMAVTLYRVLAGRLPFHDARGQPVMVVLAKHIYNEPTMLAEAAAGADIPPTIARVIESALRKRPEDRPPTMLAFAEALRVAASEATRVAPRPRWPHELLLAFGLGVGATWLATPQPVPAPSPTSNQRLAATRSPDDLDAPSGPRSSPAASSPEEADPPLAGPVIPPPTSETSTPTPLVVPEVASEPSVAQSPSGLRTLKATWRRALARRTADVQRCADETTTGSLERVSVAVNIDRAGRVFAHVTDAPDTPLSRCLAVSLRETSLPAPSEPVSLVHVFTLRATPRRP